MQDTGLELDPRAIETAEAAGHKRNQVDLSTASVADYVANGYIGSPPCQSYSNAGKGAGRKNLELVCTAMDDINNGAGIEIIKELGEDCGDIRAGLVVRPLLYAKTNLPEWIALEQVATVLPVWQEMATYLAKYGYSVETGILNSADFGVPPSRRRAILVASRKKQAHLPTPTHRNNHISVHDAVPGSEDYWFIKHNAGHRNRPRVNGKQIVNTPEGDYYQRFDLAKPSPTLTTQLSAWKFDQAVTVSDMMYRSEKSRQITIEEFSVIQSFRSDYPWRGTKGEIHRQIGDTIPPKLAEVIIKQLID